MPSKAVRRLRFPWQGLFQNKLINACAKHAFKQQCTVAASPADHPDLKPDMYKHAAISQHVLSKALDRCLTLLSNLSCWLM